MVFQLPQSASGEKRSILERAHRHLVPNGIETFAGFDASRLQFKAGLFVDHAYCDEALEKVNTAIRVACEVRNDRDARSIGRG